MALSQIPNENSFKRALSEGINIFIGSGFSLLAEDYLRKPLPTGNELKTELMSEFALADVGELSLAQIVTIVEHDRKAELRAFLEKRFTVSHFSDLYRNLANVAIKAYFTTNIDNLLQKIYSESDKSYINDMDIRGAAFGDRDAIDAVFLHGCVAHANRPFVFGVLDVASAAQADPHRWSYLASKLRTTPTIFIGYSLSDAGTLTALNPQTPFPTGDREKWLLLHPNGATPASIRYFEALGMHVIVGDTTDILEYFGTQQFSLALPKFAAPTRSTKALFPKESIPETGSSVVRPIIDFYLGAAPVWSDIFSDQIHRTSQFRRIVDKINSGTHVVAIGLPGCGKTTLMMQVAVSIDFPGHKLVTEHLTPERAQRIINALEGDNAIIFIDNCSDSVEAITLLARNSNIRIVGFDRDYYFDIASHKFPSNIFGILNVSDLSPNDIQEILENVPRGVRHETTHIPRIEEDADLSMFELMEANIVRPTLSERFRGTMNQLLEADKRLLELLLVTCYVHKGRTPVSTDMLSAYFDNEVDDYEELTELVETLGDMVTDYYGDYADTEQDHFVPRSVLLSEAVIDQANATHLREMLLKFHSRVSPTVISRYDLFRRRGYDADTMDKAFPNWNEGKAFYERLCSNDDSPYFLQQGALYLSRKKQYAEAFTWIDEAVTRSAYKIPSIRNSHAIILFRANIHRAPGDETVTATLRRSMAILRDCYLTDNRRTYHASKFSHQAIEFFDAYRDDIAIEYLRTAEDWLREEITTKPWTQKRSSSLLRQVRKRLQAGN